MSTKAKRNRPKLKKYTAMEHAILEIASHATNIAYHRSCIELICLEFFSEDEIATYPGRNPMYAEGIYKVMKQFFEPTNARTKNGKANSA